MSELNLGYFSHFSSNRLIEYIEKILLFEYLETGSPWVSKNELYLLFAKKHGIELNDIIKNLGYENELKKFLIQSKSFSIYPTQSYDDFYVAMLQIVVANSDKKASLTKFTIKKPWKADGRLINFLKYEGAVETGYLQSGKSKLKSTQHKKKLEIPICIESIDDLQVALVEIIDNTLEETGYSTISSSELSKSFLKYYQKPIRSVVKNVSPNKKLIEIIEEIPNFNIQKSNNGWSISKMNN